MLPFLQHNDSKSSPEQSKMTRQTTLEAAFARAAAIVPLIESSTTPSLTTGTSQTDNSSEINDEPIKGEDDRRVSARSRHSLSSYNERVLAHTSTSPTKDSSPRGSRAVSGATTLVDRRGGSQEELFEKSFGALDESWNIGRLPGDGLKLRSQGLRSSPRRSNSKRVKILDKTVGAMAKTKSALGKRTRDTLDSGKEQTAALYGMTSSRLRSRESKVLKASNDPPADKKPRLSKSAIQNVSPEPPVVQKKAKKPKKIWLSHGLYLGQERDFDAKLTESENKTKTPQPNSAKSEERKFMPLPMFSGARLLEEGRAFKMPFDVFSPLPPGQPRPDEWKKTHKNVFIGDAASVWKKAKPLEDSTCICTLETGCDENCFNRTMFYECDDENCNLGRKHCTNRAFDGLKRRHKAGGKYNVGVEVLKTADRGHGIRANRTFKPNQIIVEYTGEIITQEECEIRMRTRYKDAECYYLMDFDQSMILDATRGSIARFVNHSCSPNCRMIKWTVQGVPRMALFAGDNGIMTGEELTYDYNFNPYSVKNVQQCRCGSENCRGVLGPKPKEIKEALNPIVGGGKRKLQRVVEDAFEGVKQAAKKRKLNVPVPTSLKNAINKTKEQLSGRQKPKAPLSKKKPLPIGWVYVEEMKEAAPPLVRKIFQNDPEKLMRSTKRKGAANTTDDSSPAKKVKTGRTSVEFQPRKSSNGQRRGPSGSNLTRGKFSEDLGEDDEEDESQETREINRRESIKYKANSVRKNVVRTVKGRAGVKTHTSGKSIRVIGDV